jgi:hypothetical protein
MSWKFDVRSVMYDLKSIKANNNLDYLFAYTIKQPM